ncbi:DUF502 domain-containing protein [Sandaracinus amylolyticus]|uniref:DUF502 domain-containing protein n=1 Tax=Sandaracinus amylolyticus TaxID=927083 RepID=UPI001F3A3F9B|nr:DUF502 domain-containing protein [Sandaracinus amylolyticus]UJR78687.1 Transporter [Sandaracinus amylolyticus]
MSSSRRRRKEGPLGRVARWFGQGLLVFVPTVGTLWSVWLVLSWLDSLIGIGIPGLGLVLTLVLIFVTGFVASNVAGQAVIGVLERGIAHLPVVSVLYSSIKDLLGAFVGDKKSFDRPAMVAVDSSGLVKVFGFVTCDRFDDPRLSGHVAVYLPQAYNFAGNVIIVPRERVEFVDADPAQFMAFVVSGGVSAMHGARTVMDMSTLGGTRASQTSIR